ACAASGILSGRGATVSAIAGGLDSPVPAGERDAAGPGAMPAGAAHRRCGHAAARRRRPHVVLQAAMRHRIAATPRGRCCGRGATGRDARERACAVNSAS
ncbi:MAG TPA: hypothetical protein VIG68_03125, partial [Lysobacter sp.]